MYCKPLGLHGGRVGVTNRGLQQQGNYCVLLLNSSVFPVRLRSLVRAGVGGSEARHGVRGGRKW